MIGEQESDCSNRGDQDTVKIKTGNANVTKHMKKPAAYNRSDNTEQSIQSHRLFAPLRDLFAATFFFFFGLQIDPATLPPAIPFALALGITTALTKLLTGYCAARMAGVDARGRFRAGAALVARGEFSIVIAGLGVGLEPRLGPVSATYVLFLAILGPFLARMSN